MIKKLCTYLLTGSIVASTVLSPLQTSAADLEPETKIELNESSEELLNEEEKEEVDSTEDLDNKEIIEDIVVSENVENEIIPDDFSEEEVEEVIDSSDEEEIVEEEILDIDEENTEENTTETELVNTELTVDIENYTVIATGNMPENAELTVSIIDNTEDLENQVNETLPEFEIFTVYKAFDIDILVDGEKWQPVDFDELVSISIKNIDVSAIKEEAFEDEVVFNPETEEVEEFNIETVNDTIFRVEDEEVTELSLTENDDEVVFETEHFTTFVVGGVDYNTDTATATYTAGDDITAYWFSDKGLLAFIGTGDMYDYNEIPWRWDSIRDNITNVYLSDEITSIGSLAFDSCTNLALTELPATLTVINDRAFFNCPNLALAGELPSGLTTIGDNAFNSCENLALTELPSGLTTIGERAFLDCYNLALTELPSGLTTIGYYAFYDCTNLALTELPSDLTSIGHHAFSGCTNLALTGSLPSGLTTIGDFAFQDCTSLALTGSLPENITSIGRNIFYNVNPEKTHFDKNLSSVTITSDMYIPTSYTVTDTFTDGKASVTTTKYDFVGATSSAGTAPTYSGYTLKTDCTDATITIGATDADRLTLTREFQRNYQPVNAEIYVSTTINDNPVGDMYDKFMFTFSNIGCYSDNAGGFVDIQSLEGETADGVCDLCDRDEEHCICTDGLCDTCGMPENKCCCTFVWQHFMPDPDGTLMFSTREYTSDDIGKTYRYIVVEDIPVDSEKIQGMTYDTTEFLVEVYVTVENDVIVPVLKFTNRNTGEDVDSIVFNNIYENPNKFITSYKGKDYYKADATNEWSLQNGFTAYWFESDGFLYFDGTGEMPAFGIESRPWNGLNVTDVKFNDNITYVGSQLLNGFTTLTDVVLPASLTKIGAGAFAGCTNLENITPLSEGLESIGLSAFQNCKKLELTQELPSTITKIEQWAFLNSGVAFTGSLPEGLELIDSGAFENTAVAFSGDIPASVTYIGGLAFYNCLNSCFERNLSDYNITSLHTVPTRFTVVDLDDEYGTELGRKDYIGYVGYEYKATVSDTEYEHFTLSDAKDKGNLVIDKVGTHTILCRYWTADTYTITFEDYDGREISKKSYTYGATVDVPANPKRDGYTFRTWSPAIEKVSGGRTYKAVYSRNGYTVKFIADGKELVNKVYYYGDAVSIPVVPEKAGYVFKGWDKPINARCEENVTYTAVFEKEVPTPATYTIKFKDYDGELISSKVYTEGDTIKVPSDPKRSGYEFDGWSPEVSKTADADATYKAIYTKKEAVLTPETIKPDVSPITPLPATPVTPAPEVKEETKPKTPVEEEDEEDEEDDEPEEIKVIVPDKSDNEPPKTVEVPKKTYKITFVDDEGNVISTKFYKEGDAVSIPDAPEKENYEFTNWSPAFSTKAVADAEYKPIYKKVKKEEPVAPAPEEPVDKPKTPIQKAVPAIVAGVVTTGILATGYFSGLWLFLANFLFVKRRKKWHGLLNLEENSFVKNILDDSEDDVYIEDVWAKSNGNVDDFVENMKSLKTATLLPVGTRMFIYLGDGVEVVEYKDADEKKFFDALKDNLDAFGKVTLELRHDKFSVDIEVTFEAPVK